MCVIISFRTETIATIKITPFNNDGVAGSEVTIGCDVELLNPDINSTARNTTVDKKNVKHVIDDNHYMPTDNYSTPVCTIETYNIVSYS